MMILIKEIHENMLISVGKHIILWYHIPVYGNIILTTRKYITSSSDSMTYQKLSSILETFWRLDIL